MAAMPVPPETSPPERAFPDPWVFPTPGPDGFVPDDLVGLPGGFRYELLDGLLATSAAGEDDQLPGRPGHRDVAVDRSFDAVAEGLRVDEDDQVELEPLRQLRGQ